MTRKTRLPFLGLLLSIIAALISGMLSVGSETKLPLVLILFFSGMAGGASLVALIYNVKYRSRGDRN
jgi:hypothetical protein